MAEDSIKLGTIFATAEVRLGQGWTSGFARMAADVKAANGQKMVLTPTVNTAAARKGHEDLTKEAKRQADAQAAYLYRSGQQSAAQYKQHLTARLGDFKQYSAGWIKTAEGISRVEQQEAKKSQTAEKQRAAAATAARSAIVREMNAETKARDGAGRALAQATKAAEREYDRQAKAAETSFARQQAAWKKSQAQQEERGAARRQIASNVATGAMAAGGALVGGALYAGGQAATYDRSARYAGTNLDYTPAQVRALEQRVLNLSKDRRILQKPDELMQGYYDITGVARFASQPALSMDILKYGAYAATAGNTDVKTALDPGLAAMDAGLKGAQGAKQTYDTIFQGVKVGKMEFSELRGLGDMFVQAKALGVSLQEGMSAMAMLTSQGLPVQEASTALKQMMAHIIMPSPASRSTMDALGIKYGEKALDGTDLPSYLIDMRKRMQAYIGQGYKSVQHGRTGSVPVGSPGDLVAAMMPEIRGSTAERILLGNMRTDQGKRVDLNAQTYQQYMTGMAQSQAGGGALSRSLDLMAEGPAASMDRLAKSINRVEIALGQGVTPAMEKFAGWLERLVAWFESHSPQWQANVGTGALVGGGTLLAGGAATQGVLGYMGLRQLFGKAGAPALNLQGPRTLGAALLRGMGGIGTAAMDGGLAAGGILGAPVVAGGLVLKHYNDMYASAVDEQAKATEQMAGHEAPGFTQRWKAQRQGPGIERLIPAIQAASKRYGIDPRVIASVIHNETDGQGSQYVNHNKNGTTDYGVMQVNSATLQEMFKINPETYYRSGAYANDDLNIMMGTAELAAKIKGAGGNTWEGVRRYNGSGPAAEAYKQRALQYYSGLSGQSLQPARPAAASSAAASEDYHFIAPPLSATAKRAAVANAKADDELLGAGGDVYDRQRAGAVARFHAQVRAGVERNKAMAILDKELTRIADAEDKALTKAVEAESKKREAIRHHEALQAAKDAKLAHAAWLTSQKAMWKSASEAQEDVTGGDEFGPGFSLKEREKLTREMQKSAGEQHADLFGTDEYGPGLSFKERERQQKEMWSSVADQHAALFGTEEYGPGLSLKGEQKQERKADAEKSASARMFRSEWGGALSSVQGGFTHLFETALGGHGKMKSVWRSVMDDMKGTALHTISAILARWSMLQLVGGGRMGMAGASGAGMLSGLFGGGGGGGIGSMLGGLGGLFGGGRRGVAQTPDFMGPRNASAGTGGGAWSEQVPGMGGAAGAGGGAGGALGAASGMAGLFGKSLLGKGGLLHLGGAFGAALPWVGGGLILNQLMGNPLGNVFKGIKKLFHFDDPTNDRKAQRWGYDFAAHFTDGAQSHVQRREALGGIGGAKGAAGMLGGAPIHITHNGDNHNVGDVQRMHADWAWQIQAALDVTNATGIRRSGTAGG